MKKSNKPVEECKCHCHIGCKSIVCMHLVWCKHCNYQTPKTNPIIGQPTQSSTWKEELDGIVLRNGDKQDGIIGHRTYKDLKTFISTKKAIWEEEARKEQRKK